MKVVGKQYLIQLPHSAHCARHFSGRDPEVESSHSGIDLEAGTRTFKCQCLTACKLCLAFFQFGFLIGCKKCQLICYITSFFCFPDKAFFCFCFVCCLVVAFLMFWF